MKRLVALILALALFAAPAVALADASAPSLSQVFTQYVQTIVHGE